MTVDQLSLARRGNEARLGQRLRRGHQRKRGVDSLTSSSSRVTPSLQRWVFPETATADLDMKVDVLDLGGRPARVLAGLRIRSIRQLLSVPKTKLLQSPGFGLQSMAEVECKVSQYLAGKWPPRVVYQDGKENVLGVPNPGTKALVDHMLSILPEREQGILAARFGLWDGKTQTLACIGSRLGVSRERVRQIEARELHRLRRIFGSSRVKDRLGKKIDAFVDSKLKRRHALTKTNGLMGTMANDCTPQEAAMAAGFFTGCGIAKKQSWQGGFGLSPKDWKEVKGFTTRR